MRLILSTTLFLSLLAAAARAEPDSNEEVAARLLNTTVTVRSQRAKADAPAGNQARAAIGDAPNNDANLAEGVTVCSGVSIGRGLVVTFSHPAAHESPQLVRYRVTLPDGEQTKAALRVVDHYSSLSLLEVEDRTLPVLEPNETVPAVGATVFTASAAGIERPLVSTGIVSGVDRSLGGSDLPPLLQCDVLTTETSTGAAILDRSAKLVGIIVAAPQVGQRGGWVYAVPARHVKRLLDSRVPEKLVVLQRRRPTVGLTMGPGTKDGTVEVERVVPGGPADKAGIKKGDLVVEAQGRKLRSAYQAVDLILSRQPGEKINLVVQQGETRKSLDVTLGGEAGPPVQQSVNNNETQDAYIGPQVNVRVVGPNQYEVRGRGNVAELGAADNPLNALNRATARRSPGDEVSMLKAQLAAFEKVIAGLQEELRSREALQGKTSEKIQSLQDEVSVLRKQLEANQPTQAPAKAAKKSN